MEPKSNYMFDNMIMMLIITTITAMISKIAERLASMSTKRLDKLLDSVKNLFNNGTNSIIIKRTTIVFSSYREIAADSYEFHNFHLINAMLYFMRKKSVYVNTMICNLNNYSKPIDEDESMKTIMNRYKLDLIPNRTVEYNDFSITYEREITEQQTKRPGDKYSIIITISSKRSMHDIKAFLRQCYEDYINHIYGEITAGKYFYKLINIKDDFKFKKYRLNNNVTFDKLYFPEKDTILSLVDKLKSRDIPKLTLLLHGAPGCGKTSIIKALANLCEYSIIEIKLSLEMTDASLFDIFHINALQYHIFNDKSNNTKVDIVPLNKRIYILEDVDAECDIIHQRQEVEEPKPKNKSKNKSKKAKPRKNDSDSSDSDAETPYNLNKKQLTLSGILNTLDGILELNGAIIIMTTNHPEKLDKAFTRPGRISMMIELKKMLAEYANKMINDKYGRTIDTLKDYMLTPAELECYCNTANNFDELRTLVDNHVSA